MIPRLVYLRYNHDQYYRGFVKQLQEQSQYDTGMPQLMMIENKSYKLKHLQIQGQKISDSILKKILKKQFNYLQYIDLRDNLLTASFVNFLPQIKEIQVSKNFISPKKLTLLNFKSLYIQNNNVTFSDVLYMISKINQDERISYIIGQVNQKIIGRKMKFIEQFIKCRVFKKDKDYVRYLMLVTI